MNAKVGQLIIPLLIVWSVSSCNWFYADAGELELLIPAGTTAEDYSRLDIQEGAYFFRDLSVAGGSGDYSFALVADYGGLPGGISITPTGTIFGTPNADYLGGSIGILVQDKIFAYRQLYLFFSIDPIDIP